MLLQHLDDPPGAIARVPQAGFVDWFEAANALHRSKALSLDAYNVAVRELRAAFIFKTGPVWSTKPAKAAFAAMQPGQHVYVKGKENYLYAYKRATNYASAHPDRQFKGRMLPDRNGGCITCLR